MAKADTAPDQIEEQVRPPDQAELAAIEAIAQNAAQLQDEIRERMGDRAQRLKALKAELKGKLLQHGLKEITINGRPPIELTESNSRKPTRKAIIGVMEEACAKKLTDEERREPKKLKAAKAEGKMKALNLWNAIPYATSTSVKIPDPSPEELESPY
jgi:hypothetical protein